MQPTVSVVIVNYFTSELVKRAVSSLGKQGKELNIKTIIVDNSDDITEKVNLEGLRNDSVEIIVNKFNCGFGRACNIAYKKCTGKYILLLNPDAYLLEDALVNLLNLAEKDERIAGVSPLTYWDDSLTVYLPPTRPVYPSSMLLEALAFTNKYTSELYSLINRWYALNIIKLKVPINQKNLSGGVVLLRKEAIDKVGGLFDESFFLYYEDSDLFYRLTKNKYKLFINPEAAAVHNYNQSRDPKNNKKAEYMIDSYNIFLKKYDWTGIYRKILAILGKISSGKYLFTTKMLVVGENEPEMAIPNSIQSLWVAEISPNRNMVPAALFYGQGKRAKIPEDLWKWMRAGRYYVRLGSPMKFTTKIMYSFDKN